LGRQTFAANCARCHSSQEGPYENTDFRATEPDDPTLRSDWLGNDNVVLASELGTYSARSLHSNHMKSRVWEQYASRTLLEQPSDPNRPEVMHGGGRGYYRNISLLSAWAHAPFLHNNAIGAELCGQPSDPTVDFYRSPYVDSNGKPLASPPNCWPFDPSVEGRYELYKFSMELLLNPNQRIPKMFVLDQDIIIDVAPEVKIGDIETGFSLRLPKGSPAVALNSLRYKDMIQDLVLVARNPEKFEKKYATLLTAEQRSDLAANLNSLYLSLLGRSGKVILDMASDQTGFVQRYYSNVLDRIENTGHRFGEDLSDREKQALIAFVATL
jgi:hypothetical protein